MLVHVPPVVVLARVVVDASHTVVAPVMAAGNGLIVSTDMVRHEVGKVYVMRAVPVPAPVAMPVVSPMVATDRLLLPQVPPAGAQVSVVVALRQPVSGLMVPGSGFTVIVRAVLQPGIA